MLAVLFAAFPSLAEDKAREEANILFLNASDLATFKPSERPRYHLEVHFTFHRPNRPDIHGTFVRDYDSPEQMHEELEFGDFRLNRVRMQNHIWTRKNDDFVPMPIEELWRALNTTTFRMSSTDVVKRVHDHKIGGVEGRCVDFENIYGNSKQDGQICVEKNIGAVIYWKYGNREISYSDYSQFVGKVRPRRFTIVEGGLDSIVADAKYTEIEAFPPDAFAPLADAESTDVCTSSRGPIVKFSPDPDYPGSIPRGLYKGKVIVDVKVAADGHVENEAVVQTVQSDLDAAALKAVKKWHFEPGTCNGNAVTSFSKVEVTYR